MAIDLIKFRDFAYLKNGEVKKEGDDGWKDGNCGDGTLYVVGYKDEGLGGSDPEFRIELNDIGDIHNLLDVTIDTNNRLYLTFDGQPFGTGYEIPTSGGDGGDFDVSKLHFYFDNGTDPDLGKRFYLKYGDVTVTDPISFDAKMNDDGQHLDFYIGGALTKSVLLPTGSQSGVTSVIRRAGEVQVKTVAETFNELYPNHNINDYKGKVLTTKTKLLVNGVEDSYLIPTYLPIPANNTLTLNDVTVTDLPGGEQSSGRFVAVPDEENTYNLELNIKTLQGIPGQKVLFDVNQSGDNQLRMRFYNEGDDPSSDCIGYYFTAHPTSGNKYFQCEAFSYVAGDYGRLGRATIPIIDGVDGAPGSDANIDVKKGTIQTGDRADITITDEIVEGVKTYFINAVLPQAGESITITPALRYVNVTTNEQGVATGNFVPVENAENVYDVNFNLPVVNGEDGNSITNFERIYQGDEYSTYKISFSKTEPYEFNVTNGNDGKSIESVELEDGAEYDSTSGASNTYECKDGDGNIVGKFTVNNGAQGESITGPRGFSISKVQIEEGAEYDESPGANNTYEVLTEDGNVVGTFTTTNGLDGRGIQSVTLTQISGKVKTYTITFTDNTTFDFNVTDGNDGINGVNGAPGANGKTAYEIAVGYDFEGTEEEWLESLHGSDANINVVNGSVTTGENPSINVAESIIDGVKTYSISAVLPQAGSTTVITPSLRFVNVQTNEDDIATGNFTLVENTENVYDVNLNLPVVRGPKGPKGADGTTFELYRLKIIPLGDTGEEEYISGMDYWHHEIETISVQKWNKDTKEFESYDMEEFINEIEASSCVLDTFPDTVDSHNIVTNMYYGLLLMFNHHNIDHGAEGFPSNGGHGFDFYHIREDFATHLSDVYFTVKVYSNVQ